MEGRLTKMANSVFMFMHKENKFLTQFSMLSIAGFGKVIIRGVSVIQSVH